MTVCNPNLISGWLAAAKVAYIAMIALLAVAVLNSSSFFAAAANVPVMIAAITAAGVATVAYSAALIELNKCAGVGCGGEFAALRGCVIGLLASMATLTVALTAVALVAAIPFAGAVAVGAFICTFIMLTILATATVETLFGEALVAYNACQVAARRSGLDQGVLVLTGFAIAASLVGVILIAARTPLR